MVTTSDMAATAISDIVGFVVVGVFWLAFFAWTTVLGWSIQRRKEREAHYRHETEKQLIDQGQVSVEQLIRLRGQDERSSRLRRREGLKLGGLLTAGAGIGILVALQLIDTGEFELGALGWVPLGIGAALLLYAYVLYPKPRELDGGPPSVLRGGPNDQPD